MSEATPDERVEEKSVGELVALASSSISNLVRAEMDLAKLELKADAKKAAIGSAMFSAAGVLGGLVVILLSIAFAYGLVGFGLWHWAAFLIVAVVYAALAGLLILFGKWRISKIEGAKRTRKTLKEDLAALRSRGDSGAPELTA
ncbi:MULTISPECIES: phage holin family protein [Actinomadura]|uniref:Putative Holin-X, holin superfamily III n=1 Tax=Actinomadura madurae TaxID=1993 RepID=A0A1I5V8M7_9ACTN|nr:phage holin family protein [Actinomadura madurae]URM97883.1 phage holin family protein [Actinomadura madurae]URN08574.1 phage holin family protein [Actinomadura madurae]SFQ03782.1 Putative Holin-X, holin superfamily III [Actinomadura madurae]